MNDASSTGQVPRPRLLLILLVLFAGLVRVTYVNWDQSHHFHPDERAIASAVHELRLDWKNPQLNPQFFAYGSLPFYLIRATADTLSLYNPSFGNYERILLIGRALSGVLGTLTVLLVAIFGSRLYNPAVGLLAGFLLACCPLHVQNSHFMTTDVALTLMVLLALMSFVSLVQQGRLINYILSGIAIGAAVATKFSAMPLLAPFGVAILLRLGKDRRFGRAILGGFLAVVAGILMFTLGEPYAFKTFNVIEIANSFTHAIGDVSRVGLDRAWSTFVSTVFFDPYAASIAEQGRMVRQAGLLPYTNQYFGTPKYVYELQQIILWCMAPALGIAAVVGTADRIVTIGRDRWREHLVLLSYVIPFFLITGWFEVKFPRYLLPIYPILILWAAGWLWRIGQNSRLGKIATWVVAAGTFGALMALMSVYQRPHTIVTASEWVYKHIPTGSTILTQHWDEGFPFNIPNRPGVRFNIQEQPYYEPDNPQKMKQIATALAGGDFIAFQTKRLYGATTQNAERYPLTSRYFYLLFAGDLGYRLIYDHDARPQLLGIEFKDELADESLTVYDHPKVLIFKNEEKLPAEEIEQRISRGVVSKKLTRDDLLTAEASETGLLAKAEETPPIRGSVQATLWFALAVEAMGISAFFILQRWLPVAGGYALSKIIGVLLFAYFPWLLTSTGLTAFTRTTLVTTFFAMIIWGLLSWRRWETTPERREWVPVEILFWGTFLFFLIVRAYNPEAFWGEKPMDFSFLNALTRASTLPPPEPWVSGYTLHYSYFGHYVIAAFGKLCRIHTGITFNLGLALFGALTATAAFAAGCAISDRWRVGILAAIFSTLIGNLAGVREIIARSRGASEGFFGWFADARAAMGFDYFWATSRVIKDTINEYPLWTFLFADLHAHALVMPFSLAFVTLTIWWIRRDDAGVDVHKAPLLGLLGLTLGSIMVTNTWSSFTYVPFFPFIVACSWFVKRRVGWGRLVAVVLVALLLVPSSAILRQIPELAPYIEWMSAPWFTYAKLAVVGLALLFLLPGVMVPTGFIVVLAVLLYAPYWNEFFFERRNLEAVNNWGLLNPNDAHAQAYDFVNIFGLFLFAALPFVFIVWRNQLIPAGRERLSTLPKLIMWIVGLAIAAAFVLTIPFAKLMEPGELATFLHIGALNAPDPDHKYAIIGSISYGLVALAILSFHITLHHRIDPYWQRVMIFFTFVFCVTAGVDILFVWDRMNTVFKFYLESWLLLSIAAAAAVVELWGWLIRSSILRRAWKVGFVCLFLVAAFTGVTGVVGALRARHLPDSTPRPTLDGTAYLPFKDPQEAAAFDWLNREVGGIPVIAEAWGPSYQDFTRVSMNTGLPAVIGWDYHSHQRDIPNSIISKRKEDIRKLYTSDSKKAVAAILEKYKIALVYVGPVERRAYAGGNSKNFKEWPDLMTPVYQNAGVTIYGVTQQFQGSIPVTTIERVTQEAAGAEVTEQSPPGELRQPRAAAVDSQGNIWVADFDNHRIQKFTPDFEPVEAFGEQGNLPGQFKQPCDLAVGEGDLIYVADTWNARIQVLDIKGEYVREWGGAFFGPRGIAVSKAGKVYLSDTGNHRIRRFNSTGTEELTFGGLGSEAGQFREPYGISIGPDDNVYVCDNLNSRVQIFDADGKFLSQFPVDGWGSFVFSEPKVVVTPDGLIWVTVPERRVVRAYDQKGTLVQEINGTQYPMGLFEKPLGIAYSPLLRELIITDLENKLARIPLPAK